MIYQVLKAPNDRNGNPQRLTMCYCDFGLDPLLVRDHGYGGDGIPEGGRTLPTINITTNEYRCITARYRDIVK